MPPALDGQPKGLCRKPKTTKSTNENNGNFYSRYKNGVSLGQVLNTSHQMWKNRTRFQNTTRGDNRANGRN